MSEVFFVHFNNEKTYSAVPKALSPLVEKVLSQLDPGLAILPDDHFSLPDDVEHYAEVCGMPFYSGLVIFYGHFYTEEIPTLLDCVHSGIPVRAIQDI